MGTRDFTITPAGPFSLREAAEFGFGQRHAQVYDGAMRLAFVVDGWSDQVGVALRQERDDGPVTAEVVGAGDLTVIQDQVARVLSLDRDASGFLEVGARDPVIARLQGVAHGLRPPLFYSAYEAAAWCVLSARRPAQQMARVRDQLSRDHGRVFEVAGQECAAFPTPAQLSAVTEVPGLPQEKVARLHAVAEAAHSGLLDTARLAAVGPESAAHEVQTLPGIGPFYASLIVLRSLGFADLEVTEEPRAAALIGALYDLGGPATPAQIHELGQAWRPFRTWVTVLIRAAGPRLLDPAAPSPVPGRGRPGGPGAGSGRAEVSSG